MTEAEIVDKIRRDTQHVTSGEFQQEPEELGGLIYYLLRCGHPIKNYLEIGAGSGVTARTIDSFFSFDQVYLIDEGRYYHTRLQHVPKAVEWVGDSTSEATSRAVRDWRQAFDLIFIDAGHTYDNVRADTRLAMRCAADPCYLAFHDAHREAVARWLLELRGGEIEGVQYLQTWAHDPIRRHTALFRWDDGEKSR